ncbi:MAG: biotin synthase BioB [Clostridium sp.]|uniref:biotin synthase BioB n=1 Tax=Clostridium sp. TaxID=1506 RepID=UPI00305612E0
MVQQLKEKILQGYLISREEAEGLLEVQLEELCDAANEIREILCGDKFNLCTIINGKSGRCSENCKYCAQSVHFNTNVEEYSLLSLDKIVSNAVSNYSEGVQRFSIVTSGRTMTDDDLKQVCEINREISEQCGVRLCGSHGLLSLEKLQMLKDSGVTRYHNNLETSKNFFKNICTTHTYEDKVQVIKNAKKVGMEVCSGGILGLGENFKDRIDMAFELRALEVDSVPINVLNPIKGTPMENNDLVSYEDLLRTIAIYRFIMPTISIRLAGGRALLNDKGRAAFKSGADSAISGDMLTTSGISTKEDIAIVKEIGFKVENHE